MNNLTTVHRIIDAVLVMQPQFWIDSIWREIYRFYCDSFHRQKLLYWTEKKYVHFYMRKISTFAKNRIDKSVLSSSLEVTSPKLPKSNHIRCNQLIRQTFKRLQKTLKWRKKGFQSDDSHIWCIISLLLWLAKKTPNCRTFLCSEREKKITTTELKV